MSYTKENLEYVLEKLMEQGFWTRDLVTHRVSVDPCVFKGNHVGLKGWCATHPEYVLNHHASENNSYYGGRSGGKSYKHSAFLAPEIIEAAYAFYDTYTFEEMLAESRTQLAFRPNSILHPATRPTSDAHPEPLKAVSSKEDALWALTYNLKYHYGSYWCRQLSVRYRLYLRLHDDEFTKAEDGGFGEIHTRRVHKSLVQWGINRLLDCWVLFQIEDCPQFAALLGVTESFGPTELKLSIHLNAPTTLEELRRYKASVTEDVAKYMKALDTYEATMVESGVGDVNSTAKAKYAADPLSCVPMLMQSYVDGASKIARLMTTLYDTSIPVSLDYEINNEYGDRKALKFNS